MSVEEKILRSEKEEKVSTQHFLEQLKDIIHTPNEDISKNNQTNNKNQEIEKNSEKKECINGINTKEIINNKEETKTEENNEIKIDGNSLKNNQDDNNVEKEKSPEEINEKNEVVNVDKEKTEKNEKIIDIQENNNKNENKNLNENKEEIMNKNNTNNDNINKDIIEKNRINQVIEEKKNNEENEEDLNRKESKESQKSKSQKEEKHKPYPLCLNDCFKWELKAEIRGKRPFPKNFKSQYVFSGSSVFFKKLEFSILNTLHNSLNMALNMTKYNSSTNNFQYINTHDILEHIKSESINKLNNINNNSSNKIPSSPIKDNVTSSIRELLNINYPIDNTKFNYSIIDANLGIKDNLKNLFLLEFDLEQLEDIIEDINIENKETKEDLNKSQNNKDLRAIDDDCVEREIYFFVNISEI